MKPVLLMICVFFFAPELFAQNITGKVNDGKTDQPLEGVSIQLGHSGMKGVSNQQGIFSLDANSGDTIILTAIGYEKQLYILKGEKNLLVRLQPNNSVLNEVTVVGYENNRKLKEVAGGVAVVTSQDMRRGDMSSIAPALNSIPGVRMEEQTPGGSARLSIRGSVLRSPFGIRGIKTYWNDIPISSADGNTPAYFFDPAVISDLEILKGPSGSIYGAGTGGVVIINSSRPAFREQSAEASFVAGSYGLRRYGLTLKSNSEDADITALYNEQHYDGYRERQSANYRKLFNINAGLYSGEKRKVFISVFNARSHIELPGAVDRNSFEKTPRFTNPYIDSVDSRATINYTNLAVSQRYRFSDKFSNITSLYGSFGDTDHPTGSSPLAKSYFKSVSNSLGGRTRFVYQPRGLASKSKITFGAEYQQGNSAEKEYDNIYGHPGNMSSDQEIKSQQYIFFLQAEIDLPGGFIVTGGASYNKLHYKIEDLFNPAGNTDFSGKLDFDGTLAPRLALVKKITRDISVHGSISTGFGPPTTHELSPLGQINTQLKSEYGTNYEIGARGSLFNQRLSFDLSVYAMKLNDIIISHRLETGIDEYTNSGSANQRGIELLLSYTPLIQPNSFISYFKPWLSYNFQDYRFGHFVQVDESNPGNTKDFSGNNIPGIPEQVLFAGVDLSLKAGIYTNISFQHFGKRFITNENKPADVADDYQVLNARLGFRKTFGRWTLDIFGGGNNLLDQNYSEFVGINGFGGRFFQASPDINFYGGAQLKFSIQ